MAKGRKVQGGRILLQGTVNVQLCVIRIAVKVSIVFPNDCWGLLHGTEGVLPGNYTHLEYRERLEKLYALSHTGADKYDP